MQQKISDVAEFLTSLDALKAIDRRTYINGGERRENSAEHSWQLALSCWAFAEIFDEQLDVLKLIKLALVHDLGEIGAGDTFLYSKDRNTAHEKERVFVTELASHKGNPFDELLELWEEQEAGVTPEAKLMKVIDRLLPFLHNLTSQGKAWQENGINRNQVMEMHSFIEHESPEIFRWFSSKVDYAVDQGWLDAS